MTLTALRCLQIMKKWRGNLNSYPSDSLINNIDQVIEELSKYGCDNILIDFLLQFQLDKIINSYKNIKSRNPKYIKESQAKILPYIEEIFKSLQYSDADIIATDLVNHLIKNPILYPHTELVTIICPLYPSFKKIYKQAYDELCNYLIKSIENDLKQRQRKRDDWSIDATLNCRSIYCNEVDRFLKSNNVTQTWSITKDNRNHIMEYFTEMELPVNLEVLRKGSPHKLIITKTQKLHTDAKENFKKLQACYDNLNEIMATKVNESMDSL